MRGLTSFSWRTLSRRRARYALTALGIVLGVANVFGVLVTNASTTATIEQRSNGASGLGDVTVWPEPPADAEITPDPNGDAPIPAMRDRDVQAIRRLPNIVTVSRTAASEVILKSPRAKKDEAFFIAGVDLEFAERRARIVDGRWYRPGRRELILREDAAKRLGAKIGKRFTVDLPRRPSLELVGIYTKPDDATAHSFTSYETMHKISGAGVGSLQIYLDGTVEPDVWAVTYESRLPGVNFFHNGIPREFQRFISVIQTTLGGAAAIAIFVGSFLIYLTFTMSVVERTRMYGTLHAVGATGRQVRRVVLTEALGVGAAATVAGLGLGVVLSFGLIRLLGQALQLGPVPLVVTPFAILVALAVGIFATLLGAFVPARRAARLSPVEAIRVTPAIAPSGSRTWIAGIAAIVGGIAIHFITLRGRDPRPTDIAGLPILLVLFGAVLVVPPFVPPIVRATRTLIRRLAPRLGDVAVMHLVRERSRSAYTLGLLMIVLSMMLTLGTTHASIGSALNEWVQTRFGADLLAYKGGMDHEAPRRVERLDGVADVAPIAFGRAKVIRPEAAGAQNVVAIDVEKFFDVAGFPWADGETDEARRALERGGTALLPSSTTTRLGIGVGDDIVVQATEGEATFKIAATYASIAAGPEVGIVVSLKDGIRHFGMGRPDVLYIDFDRPLDTRVTNTKDTANTIEFAGQTRTLGADAIAVRKALGGETFVIEGAAIKAQAERQLSTYFGLFLAVLIIAVVVGLLGLANTMSTSIVQRFREIGVLQAVGATPKDLRRMVLAEVAALVAGALALSFAVGFVVSWMLVRSSATQLGFNVTIVYPWVWIPVLVLFAVVVAVGAAVAPSRRAERLTPVEALRYE